jgi:hypothetical protein
MKKIVMYVNNDFSGNFSTEFRPEDFGLTQEDLIDCEGTAVGEQLYEEAEKILHNRISFGYEIVEDGK